MFVDKSLFDDNFPTITNEPQEMKQNKNSKLSSNKSSKQKLAERRKLLSKKFRPRSAKQNQTTLIRKNVESSHNTSFNHLPNTGLFLSQQQQNNQKRSTLLINNEKREKTPPISKQPSMDDNSSDSMRYQQIQQQLSTNSHEENATNNNNNQRTKCNASDDAQLKVNMNIDYRDIPTFLKTPVSTNSVIQTYIMRNKTGITNRMYPSYSVYFKDSKQLIMHAIKRAKNRTSNYYISSTAVNKADKNSNSYLGKVRANFLGTEFFIYDNGRSTKDIQSIRRQSYSNSSNNNISEKPLRSELGVVLYETNILGTKGPRKMTILIPDLSENAMRWQPTMSDSLLLSSYKQNIHRGMLVLNNRAPKWNER